MALVELLAAKLYAVGAARDHLSQRAFAFAQVVIADEGIFYVLERTQRGAHIARGRGLLLGGADALRGLEFTAEKDRLSDSGGKTPHDGIEHADRVELGGAECAGRIGAS